MVKLNTWGHLSWNSYHTTGGTVDGVKKKGEGLMVGMVIPQLYKGLCKGLCFSQPELAIYYSSFQVPFRRLWSLVQTPKEWFYDYLLMVELRFVVLSVCRKSLLVVSFASKLTKI